MHQCSRGKWAFFRDSLSQRCHREMSLSLTLNASVKYLQLQVSLFLTLLSGRSSKILIFSFLLSLVMGKPLLVEEVLHLVLSQLHSSEFSLVNVGTQVPSSTTRSWAFRITPSSDGKLNSHRLKYLPKGGYNFVIVIQLLAYHSLKLSKVESHLWLLGMRWNVH